MKKRTSSVISVAASSIILVVCTALVSVTNLHSAPDNSTAHTQTGIISVSSGSGTFSSEQSDVPVDLPEAVNSDNSLPGNTDREMRGIWIPYMSLALGDSERNKTSFMKKIDNITDNCIRYRINTIIVQVRPFGDAIYPSVYFPFSHIISGKQGVKPDYNPLDYIVKKAHQCGLAVHAWINPFRISTGQTPDALADNNPYTIWKTDSIKENDRYTFSYGGGIYYNPAYPEVRKLIINGIEEIVGNYDVDGIQIDDYFYPSEETGYDREDYEKYLLSVSENTVPLSHGDWRKANIDLLISGIYDAVHQTGKNVLFGVSPQCNFDNNEKISADVKLWCSQKGYVDYICPQLYVSVEHPVFPFDSLAQKWKDTVKNSDIMLYYGLGLYKAGTNADSDTWLASDDNIKHQIEYIRSIGCNGFIFYSYDYLSKNETEKEVQNAMAVM